MFIESIMVLGQGHQLEIQYRLVYHCDKSQLLRKISIVSRNQCGRKSKGCFEGYI